MVPGDQRLTALPDQDTDVLIDVTSLIGAEDYIISQNRRARPEDPFARQCFVEIIQSLIFMSRLYVSHPVLSSPRADDFGTKPYLLRALMRAGLLLPLRMDDRQRIDARSFEEEALTDLKSPYGTRSLIQFIEQAVACDTESPGRRHSMSSRMRAWSEFQARKVRIAGHHAERISTSDGIENDDFGLWARAVALALEGSLEAVSPPGEEKYVIANLARGVKYRARANATMLCYQSHPMRRDFSLTFDLRRNGAESSLVLEVIKAVRGIQESLLDAAGEHRMHRMRLLDLELPLLGGRLWKDSEIGTQSDVSWIDMVVDRIAAYRYDAVDLRRAIEHCVTDEDYLRLARDIEEVKFNLLERLGLRRVELSALERDLVDNVASVAQATTGVPKVNGVWLGTRTLGKKLAQFKLGGRPYQQFLYREFVRAWKSTGE